MTVCPRTVIGLHTLMDAGEPLLTSCAPLTNLKFSLKKKRKISDSGHLSEPGCVVVCCTVFSWV